MDLLVKVEKILDVQTFTSKVDGREWKKYAFIGKPVKDQYPKPICFTCIGEDKWNEFGIVSGSEYVISFNLSSREYNGRWFTEALCWKATSTYRQSQKSASGSTSQQSMMNTNVEEPKEDEMPF